MALSRWLPLLVFSLIALLSVSAIQCGSGVGCLGNCEELSADAGSSEVAFTGISGIDRVEVNSLRVNWQPATEASEYLVFEVSGSPTLVARLPAPASSYTALSLVSGNTYRFRVKLLDPLKRTDRNTNDVAATTLTQAQALAEIGAPTSLKLWLKSTAGVEVTVGTNHVVKWADLSGNENHFTQFQDTKCPLFISSGGANGLPELDFSEDSLLIGPGQSLLTPHHIFVVFLASITSSPTHRLFGSAGSGGGIDYGYHSSFLVLAKSEFDVASLGGEIENNRYYYATFSSSGLSGGSLSSSGRLNGEAMLANQFSGIGEDGQVLRLGAVTGFNFLGSLSEILYFDSVLGDAERDQVETYLKERYAF